MSDTNYNTKFCIGDKVRVIRGLFKGRVGTIKSYSPLTTTGFNLDNIDRDIKVLGGNYYLDQGWFKDDLNVQEQDLELVK